MCSYENYIKYPFFLKRNLVDNNSNNYNNQELADINTPKFMLYPTQLLKCNNADAQIHDTTKNIVSYNMKNNNDNNNNNLVENDRNLKQEPTSINESYNNQNCNNNKITPIKPIPIRKKQSFQSPIHRSHNDIPLLLSTINMSNKNRKSAFNQIMNNNCAVYLNENSREIRGYKDLQTNTPIQAHVHYTINHSDVNMSYNYNNSESAVTTNITTDKLKSSNSYNINNNDNLKTNINKVNSGNTYYTPANAINLNKRKYKHKPTNAEKKLQKRVKCTYEGCSRDFLNQNQLRLHHRLHVRPFVCPFCQHKFSSKANMQRHIRTHTGEKPFACKYKGCDFNAFARRDHLNNHWKAKHLNTPYVYIKNLHTPGGCMYVSSDQPTFPPVVPTK